VLSACGFSQHTVIDRDHGVGHVLGGQRFTVFVREAVVKLEPVRHFDCSRPRRSFVTSGARSSTATCFCIAAKLMGWALVPQCKPVYPWHWSDVSLKVWLDVKPQAPLSEQNYGRTSRVALLWKPKPSLSCGT
jgi:hypothetical protein